MSTISEEMYKWLLLCVAKRADLTILDSHLKCSSEML